MKKEGTMPEKPVHIQVNESINSVIELTSRIDERVRHIMKNQEAFENKVDNQTELVNMLTTQLKLLESQTNILVQENKIIGEEFKRITIQVHDLEGSNSTIENRWKTFIGFGIQLVWVVLAAYVLYKMGIQAPAVP